MKPTILGVCALAASLLTGAAAAQQIPAAETGPTIVTAQMIDGQIEMRDASNNAPIILPRGVTPYKVRPGGDSLTPEIEFRAQPSGFDLVYTFNNAAAHRRRVGAMDIGVITLGRNITYRDFQIDGKPLAADTHRPNDYKAWTYPPYLYSPVALLQNNSYAVGVSLHYPALEYKHDVRFEMTSPGGSAAVGEGGRGWQVNIRFQNWGNEAPNTGIGREAWLNPGETRTYVVAVRVTKNPSEWIRTLAPYREYFTSLYEGVQYDRDPRPVVGYTISGSWLLSAQNPFGFAGATMRPDIHGWGPWAEEFKRQKDKWARVMLWAPSGVYRENQSLNFPFQFTTNWLRGGTRMGDAVAQLSQVQHENVQLGLWWGRSAQVMRQWDTPNWEPMNPHNSEHRAAAFAELDLAVQAGARTIGLDAIYTHTPVWDVHLWLRLMKDRHPGVKFVTEGRTPDFLHALTPTWMEFYEEYTPGRSVSEVKRVSTAFYLADFLLPGHETWGGMSFNRLREALGRELTLAEIRAESQKAADLGYVPMVFDARPLGEGFDAQRTWEHTVPADLRLDSDLATESPSTGEPSSEPPPSDSGPSPQKRGVVLRPSKPKTFIRNKNRN